MADYIDFTVEEFVAAADLLRFEPPALLFEHLLVPDPDVSEQIARSGRRFLRVRELVRETPAGIELDENLARAAELLDHATLVVVAMGVAENLSFNWLCADPETLVVLSSTGEGVWRTRMLQPDELAGAIGLLSDLDVEWPETASGKAARFELPQPAAEPDESWDIDAGSLRQSIEALPDGTRRAIEAVVGEQVEFHSVASVRRREDGTAVRSSTSWSTSVDHGGHLIELDERTLRLTPTTQDHVMDLIVKGLEA